MSLQRNNTQEAELYTYFSWNKLYLEAGTKKKKAYETSVGNIAM